MKSFLRKIIPQRQRQVLRRILEALEYGAVKIGSCIINVLPSFIKVFLISHLKVIKRMDYAKGEILLDVASSMEYRVRLRSCGREKETVEWLETYFQDNDVFYDVGANVGAYSLVAAEFYKGKVPVYSFEPSFLNFPQLCKNIHVNNFQDVITPFNIALSDKTAIDFFNYKNLTVGGATHTLGIAQDEHNNPFVPVYRLATLGYAMDEFIEEFYLPIPQHIKIDVDGNEWLILQGARKTLESTRMKSLLIEMGEEDIRIQKYLAQKGFSLEVKHRVGVPEAKLFNCVFKK